MIMFIKSIKVIKLLVTSVNGLDIKHLKWLCLFPVDKSLALHKTDKTKSPTSIFTKELQST